jgi:tetratricopeptide (TPR) repeat protein
MFPSVFFLPLTTLRRFFFLMFCGISVLYSVPAAAQDDNLSAGDLNYETLRFYERAIPFYEAVLAKKPQNASVHAKLADCYRYTNEMAKATAHFADAFKSGSVLPPQYRFHYGQTLMALGRYEEAKKQFSEFVKTDSVKAVRFIKNCDYAMSAQHAAPQFAIRAEAVNGPDSDFGPALYGDEIFFVSYRPKEKGASDFQVIRAAAGADGRLSAAKPLNDRIDINDRGFMVFSADRKTVFFAKHRLRNGIRFIGNTDMPQALLSANATNIIAWSEMQRLKINRDGSSLTCPALSADGKTLYFASDMPGGMGGMDLWACVRSGDGWGTPQNLGKTINTPGDETSPFLALDGTLYFASDWHAGFGGLDLFSAKPNGKAWQTPQNLGLPVNSSYDDFAFVENPANKQAYFTSNRPGGKGLEDIYGATRIAAAPVAQKPAPAPQSPAPPTPEKSPAKPAPAAKALYGEVREAGTNSPIAGAYVYFEPAKNNQVVETYTNEKGAYQVSLMPGVSYNVLVSASGHIEMRSTITTPDLASLQTFFLARTLARSAPPVAAKTPAETPKDVAPKGAPAQAAKPKAPSPSPAPAEKPTE